MFQEFYPKCINAQFIPNIYRFRLNNIFSKDREDNLFCISETAIALPSTCLSTKIKTHILV